jgi:hypothetical protein
MGGCSVPGLAFAFTADGDYVDCNLQPPKMFLLQNEFVNSSWKLYPGLV